MKHDNSIGFLPLLLLKKKKPAPPRAPGISIQNHTSKEKAKAHVFLFADPFFGSVHDQYWTHLNSRLQSLVDTEDVFLYEKNLSLKATTYEQFWISRFDLWQRLVNDNGDTAIKVWTVPTLLAISADLSKFVIMSGRSGWTAGVDEWVAEVKSKLLHPVPQLPPQYADGIAPPPTATNQVAPPTTTTNQVPPPPVPTATSTGLDGKTLLFIGISVVAVLLLKGKKGKKTAVSGTGKRRGRPRKNAQVGEVAAVETVQELSAETITSEAISGTPKRRGRPRKAAKVGEVAPQVAAPESATVAGKRRGRPRKAAIVAETPTAVAPAS